MFRNLLHNISAERTSIENNPAPFFFQQQKVYTFCKNYIKNKTVLEIGSGSGFGVYRLSKIAKKITAVDKDKDAINESSKLFKNNHLEFINSSSDNYFGKYDVVISLQVIEHIKQEEIPNYLNSVKKNIKTDGTFIVSTPNSLTSSYNENPYHFKEYTFDELRQLLRPYFKKIEFFSVIGDSEITQFEKKRKRMVQDFFKKDIFRIRKAIPRKIRQSLFDVVTYYQRKKYKNNIPIDHPISEKNYKVIEGEIRESLDLVAVC